MISRNNILSYVLVAIALLAGLSSCISLDEYTPTTEVSGDIEFVARPTSYNGQVVQTKATNATDFENTIHNCYLLLFDGSGNRVFLSEDIAGLTTYRISKSEIISKLGGNATCTACFIANVPKNAIDGLTTLSAVNSAVLDINYSNVDVLEANGKHSSFVVPDFDLDGNGSNEPVQCLPMFGMKECNLGTADLFEISLKRLFAKVSVNIALGSDLAQLSANFQLVATHLVNLPTKVRLAENTNECVWVTDAASFMKTQIEGPINEQVTVAAPYEFYFYVPEYYLTPLTEDEYEGPTGTYSNNQKYKPKKYDTSKNPVLVKLFGKYDDSVFSKQQDVAYDLYLGEDASTSFTLKRNMHYKNTVTISGIANSMTGEGDALDLRVDVSKMDEVQVLGQTANCYVIGEVGTYIYPACKGVWTQGLSNIPEEMMCSKGTKIEVIAQDNQSIDISNLTYNPESKEFSFDVSSINDGNVIVALTYTDEKGKKQIEWSWHLWFVTGVNFGDALEGFFDVKSQTMPNGDEMMDRNIGANINASNLDLIPGTINGIYYRYGHRAPYFTDVRTNGNGTKYHGLNESDYSTWNTDKKSVTDPCPPGYRVPASTTWNGDATKEHFEAQIAGMGISAFRYWNTSDAIFYPYTEYINENLKQAEISGSTNVTGTYPDLVQGTGVEVRNTGYSLNVNKSSGAVHSSDQKTIIYEGFSQGLLSNVEITKCEYRVFLVLFWDRWRTYTQGSSLSDTIMDFIFLTVKPKLETDVPKIQEAIRPTWTDQNTTNPKYGYQVRCVRE